jgi:hypothetical protein
MLPSARAQGMPTVGREALEGVVRTLLTGSLMSIDGKSLIAQCSCGSHNRRHNLDAEI